MHWAQSRCWAHAGSGYRARTEHNTVPSVHSWEKSPSHTVCGGTRHRWAGPACNSVIRPVWFQMPVYLKICLILQLLLILQALLSLLFKDLKTVMSLTLPNFLSSIPSFTPFDIIYWHFTFKQFVSTPHKTVVGAVTGCKLHFQDTVKLLSHLT